MMSEDPPHHVEKSAQKEVLRQPSHAVSRMPQIPLLKYFIAESFSELLYSNKFCTLPVPALIFTVAHSAQIWALLHMCALLLAKTLPLTHTGILTSPIYAISSLTVS